MEALSRLLLVFILYLWKINTRIMKIESIFKISLFVLMVNTFFSTTLYSQVNTEELNKLFESRYGDKNTGASILISQKGQVVYSRQFGYANIEHKVLVHKDTKFAIGSITKQFTAAAILILQEHGKLDIDKPLANYLEAFNTDTYSNVTLKHLLTHTSGIPPDSKDNYISSNRRTPLSPESIIDKISGEELLFAPGTKYDYSNNGYIILGMVIETMSGLPYPEFLDKHIYTPLGMKQSSVGYYQDIVMERANGYAKDDAENNINSTYHSSSYSAGAIISTPRDLNNWITALFKNQVLNKESQSLMFKNYQLNDSTKTNNGLGWEINEVSGIKTFEHSGFEPGFKANSIYEPKSESYILILQNTQADSPIPVSIRAAAIALGKPYPSKSESKKMKSDELEKYVGKYQLPNGDQRIIGLDKGQLYYKAPGGLERFLYPNEKNTFVFETEYIDLSFEENSKNEIISATFKNRNSHTELTKISNEIPKKNIEISIPVTIMKNYIGSYRSEQFIMHISIDNNTLFAQPEGSEKLRLKPKSNSEFFIPELGAEIEFVTNENDEEHIIIQLEGNTMKGLKDK